MILLSIVHVIGLLIYGSSSSWLLNLNLTCETLDKCRKWLVNFSVRKTEVVLFDHCSNSNAIDVKIDGSGLCEKSFFKILGLSFFSEFSWYSFSLLLKLPPRKQQF